MGLRAPSVPSGSSVGWAKDLVSSALGSWGVAAGLAWGPGRGMGQGVLEERFSQGSGRPNPKGLLEGLAAPRPRAGTQCLHPAERPGWKFMVMGEDLSPRIG